MIILDKTIFRLISNGTNLTHPTAWIIFEIIFTITALPGALLAGLMRVVYAMLWSTLSLIRLDVNVMPVGLEQWDLAYCSFLSYLFLYERHHHPVVMTAMRTLFALKRPDEMREASDKERRRTTLRNRLWLAVYLDRIPILQQYRYRKSEEPVVVATGTDETVLETGSDRKTLDSKTVAEATAVC